MPRTLTTLIALTTLAAVTVLSGCAHDPAPAPVVAGDPPTKPATVELSDACADAVAPVRAIVAARDYPAELTLAERRVVFATLDPVCGPGDAHRFLTGELALWLELDAPAEDAPPVVEVSAACTEALGGWRAELAAAYRAAIASPDGDDPAALADSLGEVNGCSFDELSYVHDVEWGTYARVAQHRPDPQRLDSVTVEVSPGCAAALEPFRAALADVDDVPDAALTDRLFEQLAAATGACTRAELVEVETSELQPALGNRTVR